MELDPNNAGLKSGLQNSEARIDSESVSPPSATPERSTSPSAGAAPGAGGMGGMADMLRNLGGGAGGGGGGMPDMASLLNNPMMMQMAQQMMANGGLERMMQNPTVRNMARLPSIIARRDTAQFYFRNIDGVGSERRWYALYGPDHERPHLKRFVRVLRCLSSFASCLLTAPTL